MFEGDVMLCCVIHGQLASGALSKAFLLALDLDLFASPASLVASQSILIEAKPCSFREPPRTREAQRTGPYSADLIKSLTAPLRPRDP